MQGKLSISHGQIYVSTNSEFLLFPLLLLLLLLLSLLNSISSSSSARPVWARLLVP